MFATSILRGAWFCTRASLGPWLALFVLSAHASAAETNALSPDAATIESNFLARVRATFQESRKIFLANTNDATNAWQFGRACFDLAEVATNNTSKGEIADQGIAACRRSIALDSKCAPAHYYLGMTIGQYADTKRNLAALRMVKEMEREFNVARELDEQFDYAGPDRNLGLLYFETPSFISIGSRSKARQHLERAAELAPNFPENHLNLIEVLLKWGEREAAQREFKALEKIWADAQKKFTGDTWAATWLSWQKRRAAAQTKMPASDSH